MKDYNDDGVLDFLDEATTKHTKKPDPNTRHDPKDLFITQGGIDLLKHFEGFRENAYPDPATGGEPVTIGYGFIKGVKMGDTITLQEAEERLVEELAEYEEYVRDYVKVPLKACEFSALTSFVFNLGPNNLKRSTLLKKLNKGEYGEVGEEFGKWVLGNGKVMAGLVRRREAEARLFNGDTWEGV